MAAVALLHNHVLQQEDGPGGAEKGKAKGMPKQAQAPAEGLLLWARQVSGEGMHLKKWRLILRNLPFNVSGLLFSVCILVHHLHSQDPHHVFSMKQHELSRHFTRLNSLNLTGPTLLHTRVLVVAQQ